VATIINIIPFDLDHYINKEISSRVKPSQWIKDWEENKNLIRDYDWKHELVMTQIETFSYDTYGFKKFDGSFVTKAPQNYVRVIRPI
jgi:hypothetical protein